MWPGYPNPEAIIVFGIAGVTIPVVPISPLLLVPWLVQFPSLVLLPPLLPIGCGTHGVLGGRGLGSCCAVVGGVVVGGVHLVMSQSSQLLTSLPVCLQMWTPGGNPGHKLHLGFVCLGRSTDCVSWMLLW